MTLISANLSLANTANGGSGCVEGRLTGQGFEFFSKTGVNWGLTTSSGVVGVEGVVLEGWGTYLNTPEKQGKWTPVPTYWRSASTMFTPKGEVHCTLVE